MIKGIDLSHWQGTTPSLAGLDFMFARATFGTTPDDKYAMHRANAAGAGLDFGAYHYGDPTKSVVSQLAACLAVTQGVEKVCLDIEAGNMGLADAKTFIAGLRKAGKIAGVYHSLSSYPWALGQDFDWLAAWGSVAPPGPWEFWQYRGSPLDLDYFDGTRAELDTFTHGSYIAPDTSTGADMPIALTKTGPTDVLVKIGAVLYKNSDFSGPHITATGQRYMPLIGNVDPQVARLVNFAGPDGVPTGELYWLHFADGIGFRPTPVPVADCTASVAAAVAPLNARLAGIKDKTAAFAADVASD